MDISSQLAFVSIIVIILASDNTVNPVQASTRKSISIFDYCNVTFLFGDDDWHEVILDGRLFPTGQEYCEIKCVAKNSDDILNYKVTKYRLQIYENNFAIKLESSSDGINYTQQEDISYVNPPSSPKQTVRADRQVRLSVNRVIGFVRNAFLVVIEVFGNQFRL